MRGRIAIWLGLLLCAACSAQNERSATGVQAASKPRMCGKGELMGHVPDDRQIASHRQFTLPVIARPFGSRRDDWSMELTLLVDVDGRPVCFDASDLFGRPQVLDAERKAVLAATAAWRYAPFVEDGQPVVAVVKETVSERESPERHMPLPDVPLEQVHVRLERTGCFGTCPAYAIDIHGDGRAVYTGGGFVDVEGRHEYRIPPERVAGLVRSLREKDIWSLRSSYVGGVTDNPTYLLAIGMAGEQHTIRDYVGGMAGMPAAVTEFEDEVDRAAESDAWINLGMPAVDRLVAEGFRFDAPAGGAMLGRAMANAAVHDDAAILRIMQLGALGSASAMVPNRLGWPARSLLEEALDKRRQQVAERLIEAGALETDGRLDPGKLDAAFRAAIAAGTLQGVETVWNAGGGRIRPALTYDDPSEGDKGKHRRSSVILLLSHRYRGDAWEGREIAEWLVAKGCDLKARASNGDTLLHRAAEAGDAGFVRYLLDKGLSPSAAGEFGLPPLGGVSNERVASMLLQAGTDLSMMDKDGFSFRRYAGENHWRSVVEWLDAHGVGKRKQK